MQQRTSPTVSPTLSGSVAANLAEWKKAWQEEALRLLFVISKAQAEDQHSAENCIPALFLALNPLHSDRMELLVGEMPDDLEAYVDGIMAAKGGSKVDRKAKVNSMLHLAADRQRNFTCGKSLRVCKAKSPAICPTAQRPADGCRAGKRRTTKAERDGADSGGSAMRCRDFSSVRSCAGQIGVLQNPARRFGAA